MFLTCYVLPKFIDSQNMYPKTLAFISFFASSLSLAADGDVVARMGDISLTVREARQLAEQNPQQAASAADLQRLLRTELVRRGVGAEARKQHFDKRPEVAARMEQAAEQALVTAYVNSIARPPHDFPSEQQLREAYDANKDAFKTVRQYRVSQIYVAGTDAKARKEAEDLYKQATRKRADFAAIARKSSQHAQSAAQGGDIGWVSERGLVPSIFKALQAMKRGEVNEPVLGLEGYHILQLEEIKEPEILPLEKVKNVLANNMRLRKAKEVEAAYLDGLLARSPIAVNEIALGELILKSK